MRREADRPVVPPLDRGLHAGEASPAAADRSPRVPAPPVAIAAETPLQGDVRRMVADLNAYLRPLSPPEFQFQLTVEEMAEPSVTVFVARDEAGQAIGMASLKDHGGGLGEVKRMYVFPELRGKRIGALLVERIEALARERGLDRLVLETGEAPGFEAAWRVYEHAGFTICGAVLDYPDSGFSRFYEKALTPASTA